MLGKPLIAHTLEQANSCELFDAIAVSSDSKEILEVAGEYGATILVLRPDKLATDTSAKVPAIQHCVRHAEKISSKQFEVVVDLDATAPLRLPDDIIGSVNLLEMKDASNVITAAPARRSPYFNLVELGDNGVVRLSKPLDVPVVRRQDSPLCFDMNASIYVWKYSVLFESSTLFNAGTRLFEMPEERSIDIDNELDFDIVEFLMKKRSRV